MEMEVGHLLPPLKTLVTDQPVPLPPNTQLLNDRAHASKKTCEKGLRRLGIKRRPMGIGALGNQEYMDGSLGVQIRKRQQIGIVVKFLTRHLSP
jgi:hypothetical protein